MIRENGILNELINTIFCHIDGYLSVVVVVGSRELARECNKFSLNFNVVSATHDANDSLLLRQRDSS